MTNTTWERLQQLFEAALQQPEDERAEFLDAACEGDAALRAEVEALLSADLRNTQESGDSFLDQLEDADSQLEDTTVGGWHIRERIGVGGMGSVYLAERADGDFEQRVALKVIKKGMDSESVVRRFRQERQILARLNHPNIARLVDGGLTEDGRPYFAMEYVDGLPITEYCDTHRLTVDERLRLFRHACDAVHHAHRSLVVHRDLKPSNIIVTKAGELKLLDFGIAKLLDNTEDRHLTRTGMQLHTPAYAAPEQLLDEAITTATDVYALGIILYELLSGRRPFEVRRTPDTLRDDVLSGNPPKPSAALTRVPADTAGGVRTQSIEEVSALRGARVERLKKSLAGDLDTICLMAMHREPDHRYSSANQMADDIRRHLDGLPVIASPDSVAYRAAKFYERHRVGVLGSIAVAVAFAALVSFYTVRLAEERDVALLEQQKANEVVDFVTGLFEVSDPSESRGEEITARDLLDAGANRINNELGDRPEIQATMRRVLGEVYYSLGSSDVAEDLLTSALDQSLQLYGDEHLDVATAKIALGVLLQVNGASERVGALYVEALETRRTLRGGDHMDVMEAISVLAFFEETRGEFEAAERLFVEALAMGRRLFDEDHGFLAEAMTNLAGIYRILDRPAEAEPLLREALAMQIRLFDGVHPEIDDTKRQLAGLLRDTQRFDESRALYDEVIESRTRMLGPDHLEVAHVWNSYSQLLASMGDMDGALDANRTFIEIMERAYAGPHPSLGAAYHNLASFLVDMGEYDTAIENFQRSIDMQDAVGLPARHPNRAYPMAGQAGVLLRQERFAEARDAYQRVLELRRENYPEDHALITEVKSALGAALTGLGEFDQAEALLTEAYDRFLADWGSDHSRTLTTVDHLVALYEATGNEAEAERFRALQPAN